MLLFSCKPLINIIQQKTGLESMRIHWLNALKGQIQPWKNVWSTLIKITLTAFKLNFNQNGAKIYRSKQVISRTIGDMEIILRRILWTSFI